MHLNGIYKVLFRRLAQIEGTEDLHCARYLPLNYEKNLSPARCRRLAQHPERLGEYLQRRHSGGRGPGREPYLRSNTGIISVGVILALSATVGFPTMHLNPIYKYDSDE